MAFCASTVYNWPFFLSSLLELSGHKPIDDDSLIKEMKMENKNLAKKLYSGGSHLPPKLSNDGSANFVSTFFFSSSNTPFTPAKHVLLNWFLLNENYKQRTEKLDFP